MILPDQSPCLHPVALTSGADLGRAGRIRRNQGYSHAQPHFQSRPGRRSSGGADALGAGPGSRCSPGRAGCRAALSAGHRPGPAASASRNRRGASLADAQPAAPGASGDGMHGRRLARRFPRGHHDDRHDAHPAGRGRQLVDREQPVSRHRRPARDARGAIGLRAACPAGRPARRDPLHRAGDLVRTRRPRAVLATPAGPGLPGFSPCPPAERSLR